MIGFWYGIISLMLIIYVVLDGRNFGAGMLHWFVARTPEERRQVAAAIGPLWTWHEVWWPRLLRAIIWRSFLFYGA
jgi:cytochrome d ubiquinol oxidase subunit II